jgi:hypothetical protein
MSGINILMENNQVTSKKRKKEESGENGLTYGNRPSASCIPGERINILSGKKKNNSRRPDFTTQNKLYHQEGVPKHYV